MTKMQEEKNFSQKKIWNFNAIELNKRRDDTKSNLLVFFHLLFKQTRKKKKLNYLRAVGADESRATQKKIVEQTLIKLFFDVHKIS